MKARLSLDGKDRPADQTFQTEEWVRVSDFDVGTPTSTTNSKGDYDAGVEDSYGEARGHDKLADWETVSRETVGASSSPEESLEAEHLVADESSGSSHGRGLRLPHVDEGSSESSSYEQEKSASSSSEGTSPGKQEEEDRSGSIVVVPSPHEHEDDDSIVDVASHEAQEDEDHGSIVEVNLPEEQPEEDQINRIGHDIPVQDQEGKDSVSGVHVTLPDDQKDDDQTSSGLHASREEIEGDGSSFKEAPAAEVKGLRNEGPVEYESVEKESARPAESVVEVDATRLDEAPASKAEERSHDAPEHESEHEVHVVAEDDIPFQHKADESAVENSQVAVGPAAPDKEEQEYQAKSYAVTRAIRHEDDEYSGNTLTGDQERSVGLAEVSSSEVQSAVQDREEDAAPVISGVPEPEQQELDQLLDMAHSKEIAALGREEEKILAKEEEDLGKSIADPRPLAEVLAATEEDSHFLQTGESEDLQPVPVEEAPLVETPPFSQDSSLQKDTELIDRAPEVTEAGTGKQSQNLEASPGGSEERRKEDVVIADQGGGHDLTDQNLILDETRKEEKTLATEDFATADQGLHAGGPSAVKEEEEEEATVPGTDLPLSSQSNVLLLESEKEKLVPLQSLTGSEVPKIRAEPSNDAGLSGKELTSAGQGGSAEYLQHYVSPKKTEVSLSSY